MPLVTIVNPSPRKGKKMATRKKARTAAQKAATRKMIAANRARSRAARSPAKRSSLKRRRARRAAAPAAPRRAKRRASRRRSWPITSKAAASRAGRKLRYRRPNPISFLTNTVVPAAVGGAGALALDVAFGVLPLPPALKTGPMSPLVKVAGAVGLGMLASKMVNRRVGEQITVGALTVQMYNFAKGMLIRVGGGKIPGLSMYPSGPLSEYVSGDEVPALAYTDSGVQVDEYVSDDDGSMAGYESGVYR